MSSVATLVLVLIQPLWGVISDKSKNKNRIAGLLIVLCGISGLAVYLMKELWWIALCTMSVAVFFSPAITLQDNCTLEMTEGTRWNFGNIRLAVRSAIWSARRSWAFSSAITAKFTGGLRSSSFLPD